MIGALWFLAQVAAIGVIAVGVLAQPLRWSRAPWWWVVFAGVQANAAGQFAGAGRWDLAAACSLLGLAGAWYLGVIINDRRAKAAGTPERWEPTL